MEKWLKDISPVMDVEHDCILSKQEDITIAFRAVLPEIFTQSVDDFEAFLQAWIKALKILPKDSVLHQQGWFVSSRYKVNAGNVNSSFLTRSAERYFSGWPFLERQCYVLH